MPCCCIAIDIVRRARDEEDSRLWWETFAARLMSLDAQPGSAAAAERRAVGIEALQALLGDEDDMPDLLDTIIIDREGQDW